MVRHIVSWKLRDDVRAEAAPIIKRRLEGLVGQIPQLISMHVGQVFGAGEYDLALYSEFATRGDLQIYNDHPLHRAVSEYISTVRVSRMMLDFED